MDVPWGTKTVPMEIDEKKQPLVYGPVFFATNMEKPKVAVSTPSQHSRRKRFRKDFSAGDDGNRAGGVHGFVEGVSSEK